MKMANINEWKAANLVNEMSKLMNEIGQYNKMNAHLCLTDYNLVCGLRDEIFFLLLSLLHVQRSYITYVCITYWRAFPRK